MHANVESSHWNRMIPNAFQNISETSGDMDATTLHTQNDDILASVVPFGNLMRDASEYPVHGRGVEDNIPIGHKKIEPARQGGSMNEI